jgi:hypothetical protein
MRARKPKKRNAWLITWESSREDYLKDLQRPRVVAILKPQISSSTIRAVVRVLFTSESHLTFSEKIGYSFYRQSPSFLRTDFQGAICCGDNPWLHARHVSELFVETCENTQWRQTLHWMEHPRYTIDPETHHPVEAFPAQPRSEDVHFDVLWYGKSFLDEDQRA